LNVMMMPVWAEAKKTPHRRAKAESKNFFIGRKNRTGQRLPLTGPAVDYFAMPLSQRAPSFHAKIVKPSAISAATRMTASPQAVVISGKEPVANMFIVLSFF
jgi:hypothetical protein